MKRLSAHGRWPEAIDVWCIPLALAQTVASVPLLDDGERARAMRYRQRADQIRFAATRSALRQLLAQAMGIDPHRLLFVQSDRGKPQLSGCECLSFNVSHAGECALIALSRMWEVGVDIEATDAALDWRQLSALVCTAAEKRVLDGTPSAAQPGQFLRCWTAKEALLKALGLGITEGLLALTVDMDSREVGVSPKVAVDAPGFEAAGKLKYCWLDDVPGYVGCVAYGPARC